MIQILGTLVPWAGVHKFGLVDIAAQL